MEKNLSTPSGTPLGRRTENTPCRELHENDDLNISDDSHHHTLGKSPGQAARGTDLKALEDKTWSYYARESINIQNNGTVALNTSQDNLWGTFTPIAANRQNSKIVQVSFFNHAYAGGNQDVSYELQVSVNGSAYVVIDTAYTQNGGTASNDLGCFMTAWYLIPAGATALTFRVLADIAGGGFSVTNRGSKWAATFMA